MTPPTVPAPSSFPSRASKGVVLVIALVMLVVISLLAALGVRNATSSEAISGAVRTTELAAQAAEIALRYCESLALAPQAATQGGTSEHVQEPPTDAFAAPLVRPVHGRPLWQDAENWDNPSPAVIQLPLHAVNQAGTAGTYRRAPECMIDPLPIAQADASTPRTTATTTALTAAATAAAASTATTAPLSAFVITARGFGPEVPADPSHGRPAGTEVWLQSQIEQASPGTATPRSTTRTWRQLFMR
jgi:type IV pilus assembly protein PilX